MAYFHIDRAQAYVQSLGFPNVLNRADPRERERADPGPVHGGRPGQLVLRPAHRRADLRDRLGGRRRGRRDDRPRVRPRDPGGQIPGFPLTDAAAAIGEGWGTTSPRRCPPSTRRGRLRRLLRRVGRVRRGAGRLPAPRGPGIASRRPSADCTGRHRRALRGRGLVGRALGDPGRARRTGGRQARAPVAFQPDPVGELRPGGHAPCWPPTRALYGGRSPRVLKAVLGARGLVDVERLDDTPADADAARRARAGERPARLGSDVHDVYALKLHRARPVVLRLATPAGGLRPSPAGAGSRQFERAARGGGRGPSGNEEIRYTPGVSGSYYLDVRAVSRQRALHARGRVRRPRRRRRARLRGPLPERVRPAPARLGPRRARRPLRPQRARDPDRREAARAGAARTRPDVAGHGAGQGLRLRVGSAVCKRARCTLPAGSHAAATVVCRRRPRGAPDKLAPRPLPPAARGDAPSGYERVRTSTRSVLVRR